MKAEREEQLELVVRDGKDGSHSKIATQRPKRNIMQKNLEYNNGLLWREEKELKKALYASLQETKKNRLYECETGNELQRHAKENIRKRKKNGLLNGEGFDDSPNATPKRTKVHAQRKFAQGSNPNSPAPTPVKFRNNSVTNLDILPSKHPKTEDFLTFLCLRSTTVLPPSLDFFSLASRSDISSDSRCQSPTSSDFTERPRTVMKQNVLKTPNKNGKVNKSFRVGHSKRYKEKHQYSDSELDDSEIENEIYDKHDRLRGYGDRRYSEHSGRASCLNSFPFQGKTKTVSSVQALKNKYKQQRLAKQKKVMAQAKKMHDTKLGPNKEPDEQSPSGKNSSNDAKGKKNKYGQQEEKVPKKKSGDGSATKKGICKKEEIASGKNSKRLLGRRLGLADAEKSQVICSRVESSRPVTRNSTMITRSVKEELDRAAFEASKRASESRDKKDGKHNSGSKSSANKKGSAGKNADKSKQKTTKPDVRSLRSSNRNVSARLSDFSTDDDEPLAKKFKNFPVAKKQSAAGKKKNSLSDSNFKEKSPKLSGGKFLRSCVVDLSKKSSERNALLKTPPGRPTRKTKEAATVYLELLGKKLISSDSFDSCKKKVKKAAPASAAKATKPSSTRSSDSVQGTCHTELRQTRAKTEENLKFAQSKLLSSESKQKNNKALKNKSKHFVADLESSKRSTKQTSKPDKTSLEKKKKSVVCKMPKHLQEQSPKKGKGALAAEAKKDSTKKKKHDATKYHDKSKKKSESSKADDDDRISSSTARKGLDFDVSLHGSLESDLTDTPKKAKLSSKAKISDSDKISSRVKDTKKEKFDDSSEILQRELVGVKKGSHVGDNNSSNCCSRNKSVKNSDLVPSLNYSDLVSPCKDPPGSLGDLSDFDDGIVHVGESTSIAVKENVSSNSVAVQVNLVDDISEFDEEILDFAGSDFGSENSLTLERILTPTCFLDARLDSSPKNHLENYLNNVTTTNSDMQKCKTTLSAKDEPVPKKSLSPTSSPSKAKITIKEESPLELPSNSSPPSAKRRGRPPKIKTKKERNFCTSEMQPFPSTYETAKFVDAPTFFPTMEEFNDPLEYIEKIRPEAENYGICRIIPPASFKPECKVNDEMRFTAHNQYIHKMLQRFGPNVLQTACIRHHVESQGGDFEQAIMIGGMELDLPRLYETVERHGGLKEVIEKKKWQKIADAIRIPKSAQDRVTKLYDAYCKYLLSYSTLSKDEQQKLENQVKSERNRKKNKVHTEIDECIVKGRSMSLSSFYRIARNTMSMWFKHDPQPEEVETEYWKLVTERQHHVCVHAGNVDSSVYGYGFACNKNSPFGRHPWNLKVLTNNPSSVLRSMGPIMGVTIPTLHVGMLFTTGCWYRDPHCLPWIEYLHTGASKIWYGVPASHSQKFRNAMTKVVPEYSTSNPIWLPSDTAMVPPNMLVEHGTSLCRIIQHSGQFVLVFPRAFTSTICCGYTVSESVYFAHQGWLESAQEAFQEIRDSCEPAVFSLERLLFCIASDTRTQPEILQKIQPMIECIRENELSLRKVLYDLGLKNSEYLPKLEVKEMKRRRRGPDEDQEYECEVCRANCYISMVIHPEEDVVYCLSHAIEHLQRKKRDLKYFKLLYTYDQGSLNELSQRLTEKINNYLQKKISNKKSPKKK